MSTPNKTIVIDPNFLKLPMKGGRTRKNHREDGPVPKPIKIRSEKKHESDKTIKRRAINYIRKQQEDRYKRLVKGLDDNNSQTTTKVEVTNGKNYADEFKSDFDDSLAFLQKMADQSAQNKQVKNATLRYNPPITPESLLLQSPSMLNKVLNEHISLEEPAVFRDGIMANPSPLRLPSPIYGCLKGGKLPTYRTLKSQPLNVLGGQNLGQMNMQSNSATTNEATAIRLPRLTPEQQRSELKHFLEKRKEEKERVERVKRQRNMIKPGRKQKRTTTRTFRVGKSKHYPRVGVLIPNKTIRTQVLAKKQKIRETPLEDVRKYLIKNGMIRVGSSCPNDVLRKMYESSMMMCGEIQNHNPDNLLYNFLHNGM